MLAAGIAVPVLAALNAALGRHISAPAAASVALFTIALFTTVIAILVTRQTGALTQLATAPKGLLFAGVLIAFYVLSITYIAPTFGVGNAVFFVLLGQLISAAAIDHFALFGAQHTPLTLTRAAGIACMALGVFLTQKA